MWTPRTWLEEDLMRRAMDIPKTCWMDLLGLATVSPPLPLHPPLVPHHICLPSSMNKSGTVGGGYKSLDKRTDSSDEGNLLHGELFAKLCKAVQRNSE